MALKTEADVVRSLAGKAVTIDEVYDACERAGVTMRNGGHDPIPSHTGDRVWRRRARNALQAMKRSGLAERVGRGVWLIDGTRDEPERMLLVLPSTCHPIELVLGDAERFLREQDEPIDMVIADPPYGLYDGHHSERDTKAERVYNRDAAMVVDGYVEETGPYGEFTHRWMTAARDALLPGAHLVVITGTSKAWHVGHAAHDLGLTEVCQIAVQRRFALATSRRPSYAHWVVSIFCIGSLYSKLRFFHVPPELPTARSGRPYPLDVWAGDAAPPKAERRGLLRYRNALPVELPDRLIRMLTPGPDNGGLPWEALVADPFLGSGTTAVACLRQQRRFVGADLNPQSLRFTAARLNEEN